MKKTFTNLEEIHELRESLRKHPYFEEDDLFLSEALLLFGETELCDIIADAFAIGYSRGYDRAIEGGF